MPTADARTQIRDRALHLGFDAIGFTEAFLAPEARQRLSEFLQSGHHGEMDWLAARADQRSHPQSLWPDARSVIVLGTSYAPAHDPMDALNHPDQGAISVYAGNRDYHDIVKGKLKHLAQFVVSRFPCQVKVFVDTAPVMEKPLAQQSGLGWQGKHTNLVSREHGSWLFLSEIYTTLKIPADPPESDHCGSCSRCLTICPTNAFIAPYRLDATKCISYLTIEHKGPIPRHLRPAIGNRIYGCDDCLSVCPWNKFARPTENPAFIARDDLSAARLADLAGLTDNEFRQKFSASPIKRIGRDRFIRNVLTAIGNSRDITLKPVADRLRHDPNPIVAEAAAWASDQLSACSSSARA